MARRRNRGERYPTIRVTFRDGTTKEMLLMGDSSTGKSIRVMLDKEQMYLRKDQITYNLK